MQMSGNKKQDARMGIRKIMKIEDGRMAVRRIMKVQDARMGVPMLTIILL
jgi:hypothetical protein